MSRESEVADLLRADDTLLSILPGGIFTDQEIGVEGIRRGDDDPESTNYSPTANAFDEDGFLRPCALVRQRALVPAFGLRDLKIKHASTSIVVEVYFYQDRGHEAIDAAKDRVYVLLEGHPLSAAWPTAWALETAPVPDAGPLKNSTALRADYQVVSIRRGT